MFLVKRVWTSRIREEEDKCFRINDVNALPNLGKIDCIFVDKTGTITTRKSKIINILVKNKIFVFGANTKKLTSSYLNKYSTYLKKIQKEESMVPVEEKSISGYGGPMMSAKGEAKDPPEEISLKDLEFPNEDIISSMNFFFIFVLKQAKF
jgi:magnesium-transporting ATPase (P-type)